jgi:hypothetical protein
MNGARWSAIAATLLMATVALSASSEDVRITPISSGGQVLVSIAVRDAWTMGTREVLQSGLVLRFEYEVELRKPGSLPFGLTDTTLADASITARAQYDTLSGGYKVSRMRDGHVIKSDQFHQEGEVRDWLTNVERVALDPVKPLEVNAEYAVHVRLTTSPRRSVSLFSILPFGKEEITGRETFTYIK